MAFLKSYLVLLAMSALSPGTSASEGFPICHSTVIVTFYFVLFIIIYPLPYAIFCLMLFFFYQCLTTFYSHVTFLMLAHHKTL